MNKWTKLNGKKILLTGGTGSFGNAAVRNWLKTEVDCINILSRDEKKQEEMRMKYNDSRLRFFLGDVRDIESVTNAIKGCSFVFHAAALKQVPSTEFFPLEAVKTNILGSNNVLEAAIHNGIKKIVFLSTDKAVYPINAMGMSKAMMEKVALSKVRQSGHETEICVTRYGNVMASRGSVIPLFVKQIMNSMPITITDPSMTRFLMSLEDSVDLINFAFEEGTSGDLLVQKSPACTVETLAIALNKIFGGKSDFNYIGTRHGEKLYESLLSREERAKAIEHLQYFQVPIDERNLNYSNYVEAGINRGVTHEEYSSHNTERLDVSRTIEKLREISFIKEQLVA